MLFDKKNTHQAFAGRPVHFIVDTDAGLAGLEHIWKAADLQDQQVHGIQDFLAVYDTVG